MDIFSEFERIEINKETIESFQTEDDFSLIGVELAKELACVTSVLVCSRMSEPPCFDRNTAIIYGLGNRLNKLYRAIIENYCNKKSEIIQILQRCLIEAYIDLLCLAKSDDKEDFDNYLKYSLASDFKFLSHIEENIKERGSETPIETRMKKSIAYYCEQAGLSIEEVKKFKKKSWKGNTIYDRFMFCDKEKFYDAYRMCTHSVHGTWTNMLLFDITKTVEGFDIDPDWRCPDLRILTPISIFICDGMLAFANLIIPQELVGYYKERLEDIQQRAILLNHLHEEFIVKTMNK